MLLKAKRQTNESDDMFKSSDVSSNKPIPKIQTTYTNAQPVMPANKAVNDYDWNVVDEYDPMWPNEYEKLKERREKDIERSRDRDRSRDDRKRRNPRYNENDSPSSKYSGFGGRSDDTENYNKSPPPAQSRTGGAAIAPPPSLQESKPIIPAFQGGNASAAYSSGSVAAKIMAKYGFKDGQGLGKQEQGMSMALQVEKTSKRGGRIIHEKEINQPSAPSPPATANQSQVPKEEPSITEIMKAPSKVVLLRVLL